MVKIIGDGPNLRGILDGFNTLNQIPPLFSSGLVPTVTVGVTKTHRFLLSLQRHLLLATVSSAIVLTLHRSPDTPDVP